LATKEFIARFGRAKNLGDRTLGCQDPGATSIALMFSGFADALQ
jgi:phosphoenolpyruvate---glycerone phosphotransferase subunit DhaL